MRSPACLPRGRKAFLRDAPHARIELIDGGRFLLESNIEDARTHHPGMAGQLLEVPPLGGVTQPARACRPIPYDV